MPVALLNPSEAASSRLSRRALLGAAAGAAVASRFAHAPPALADDVALRFGGDRRHRCRADPIPGGLRPFLPADPTLFHVFLPGHDPATGRLNEPATITNFAGLIGLADLRETGTETNLRTGEQRQLSWEADLRFMHGHLADRDGRHLAECTFGFI